MDHRINIWGWCVALAAAIAFSKSTLASTAFSRASDPRSVANALR
jgi:hypothetical protein